MPPPIARAIAVLGTASDVGKSTIATALCRLLSNRGLCVAPFKAQNLSNNSGATLDGLEMGRAQILQAEAARIEPHVDMNPVLLKPTSDQQCQIILCGRPAESRDAVGGFAHCGELRTVAYAALGRLRRRTDVVVIEGAGSCAEWNLRARDYANFDAAHAADAPVILVADIDRGGVFAQIVGTLEVARPEDRARVRGVIINRMRGAPESFRGGIGYLEKRTGVPVLGIVPHLPDLSLDAEDAVALERLLDPQQATRDPNRGNIAVIALPHISNFTDFDALRRDSRLAVHYLRIPRALSDYDAVILPGSKSVRADLHWLRTTRWEVELSRYEKEGGRLLGICGGYQMLGRRISDPRGVEGPPGTTPGLGWLDCETELHAEKIVRRVAGSCRLTGAPVRGYEIHMGRTRSGQRPWLTLCEPVGQIDPYLDGGVRSDERVLGCYVHGLFDSPEFVDALLSRWRPDLAMRPRTLPPDEIDRLTAHFERHVDVERLLALTAIHEVLPHAGQSSATPRTVTQS